MDINFLFTKKENRKKKEVDRKKEAAQIKWTEPEKEKPLPAKNENGKKESPLKDKNKFLDLFPFFKKQPEFPLGQKAVGISPDREKINRSREEVLRLIREHEAKEVKKAVTLNRPALSFFSLIKKLFKKRAKKEFLIDYQRAMRAEREKAEEDKRRLRELHAKEAKIKKEEIKVEPVKAKIEKPKREFKLSGIFKRQKEGGQKAEKREEIKEREEEGKILASPNILETNLIRGEAVLFFDWRKNAVIFFIFLIIPCLAIGGAWWGLNLWENKKQEEADAFALEMEKLTKEIKEEKSGLEEINAFKDKLKLVTALLDSHVYWTNFFKFLENNTLADVYFASFAGGVDGKYGLAAKAKNFHTVVEQIKAMRNNENVLDVGASGGKIGSAGDKNKSGSVDFELSLSVNPALFKK